jgi:hypothetical protein
MNDDDEFCFEISSVKLNIWENIYILRQNIMIINVQRVMDLKISKLEHPVDRKLFS